MTSRTGKLLLLDTASLYFRAFYGVPDTVRAADGTPVNAVRGLLDMIAKLTALSAPTQIVACWDDDWRPQWRVDLLPTYKTHRVAVAAEEGPDTEEVPDPLEAQIPLIRESLSVLGIPVIGAAEHEADDVIGTLSAISADPVDIVTGDRDLFQLVDDARSVRIVYTARGMSNLDIVTADTIAQRYGIRPDQYADFATLRGDASDGLPGVPGIGEKTAATLLRDHGDLAGIRAAAAAGMGMTARLQQKIGEAADYLDVAPRVVRVVRDLPLTLPATPLRPLSETALAQADALSQRANIGSSMSRALRAIGDAAA